MADKRRERRWRLPGGEPVRAVGQRQRRVGEELRHALAEILRDGECRDPVLRDASITVTEVQISPDLRNAAVFVMPLGGAHAAETIAALRRSAGFLRGALGRNLALRFAPSLEFALDRGFDQADRISRLLALPEVARDLQNRDPAEHPENAN